MSTIPESALNEVGREMAGLEPSGTMAEQLREFVALEKRRRELETELAQISDRSAALSALLLDSMADAGMQSARIDGMTVYIRRDLYVSKRKEAESADVCNVLRRIGCDYMVGESYNAASLKSKVKEYMDQDAVEAEPFDAKLSRVPPELAVLLNIGETPRVIAKK